MNSLVKFKVFAPSVLYPVAIAMLIVNHIVGIIGLNIPVSRSLFENISYINLIISFVLVTAFHSPVNRNLYLFCAGAFVSGMAAEIAGVNTGFPFGAYSYTPALGPQLYHVPIVIGLNWILLSYVCAVFMKRFVKQGWGSIVAAGILMVAIDILLEGFAIRHHFWSWKNHIPPVTNYISWLLVSVFIQFVFQKLISGCTNVIASKYLLVLFLFLLLDQVVSSCC